MGVLLGIGELGLNLLGLLQIGVSNLYASIQL